MLHAFLMRTAAGESVSDEGKGAVGVDGESRRDDQAHVVLGALVELLGERGDVDAVLTEARQQGAHGKSRGRRN